MNKQEIKSLKVGMLIQRIGGSQSIFEIKSIEENGIHVVQENKGKSWITLEKHYKIYQPKF